jgi:hypothetical protein
MIDWHARLVTYMADCRARPFAPGHHDCALFAAGAVQAMTGVDPAAEWRGRYTTHRGGLRVLRRAGFRDHIEVAAALFAEIPLAQALPGDLAAIDTGCGPALGVMQGAAIYVLKPDGLGLLPRNAATRAFRVN